MSRRQFYYAIARRRTGVIESFGRVQTKGKVQPPRGRVIVYSRSPIDPARHCVRAGRLQQKPVADAPEITLTATTAFIEVPEGTQIRTPGVAGPLVKRRQHAFAVRFYHPEYRIPPVSIPALGVLGG